MNKWIKKDLKYIWHPYTQMKDCERLPPILIDRAKGVKLYDSNGKFYYDTISSWWCNVHGHNHPKIKNAIKKQLDKLEHTLFAGFTHRPAIELAEKLVKITPKNLTKVFFSDNGSTAVEAALKMSFQYWHNIGKREKTKFVSFDNGYHGDTIGAMSVSGVGLFNELFSPLFFKSYKIPSPYHIEQLEDLLKKRAGSICAIIIEPLVMAAGGMIIYPKEYLIKIAELAKKYNVHLILDEIATGFGRTGKMFACEYANVQPDFMCLSKGITAGYLPLGATLTTDEIHNAFYADYNKRKTFYHGHTYTANPLSCSAAIASLKIFEEENTLEKVNKLASVLQNRMEEFRKYPFVGDIRCLGVIGALELVKVRSFGSTRASTASEAAPVCVSEATPVCAESVLNSVEDCKKPVSPGMLGALAAANNRKTKESFEFKRRMGLSIYKDGLKHNLMLRPLGGVIYLFLPLSITLIELNDIIKKMHLTFRLSRL